MAKVKVTQGETDRFRISNAINKNADGAIFATANFTADNRLVKTDRPSVDGKEVQQSGITVDDSDNVSGVVNLTLTGVVSAPDGATATPVFTNTGDLDTGFFFPAANTIGVVTGGTQVYVVDSGNRVIVGHSESVAIGGNQMVMQNHATAGGAGYSATRWSNNAAGPISTLAKSRSTTIGTSGTGSKVLNNDELGVLRFAGDDDTDVQSQGAEIRALASADASADNLTVRLEFRTANGAATPTTRVTIAPAGMVTCTSEVRIAGDVGGVAAHNTITGASDLTANSTGTGTVKFKGATSRDSAGFIKIYIGTTPYYIPVFSAITG